MPKLPFAVLIASIAGMPAPAQTPTGTDGQTATYISAGFAAMDSNKGGKVDRVEFDRFIYARLARQAAAFEATLKQLDVNGDGAISWSEAAAGNALLVQHFTSVDTNGDGSVSKKISRAAVAAAQAQEAGIS